MRAITLISCIVDAIREVCQHRGDSATILRDKVVAETGKNLLIVQVYDGETGRFSEFEVIVLKTRTGVRKAGKGEKDAS